MKPLLQFVDECCLLARNARYPAVDLYLIYVYWCLEEGVPVQDQFTFVDLLECAGVKYRGRRRGGYFRGIAVLPAYRPGVAGGST